MDRAQLKYLLNSGPSRVLDVRKLHFEQKLVPLFKCGILNSTILIKQSAGEELEAAIREVMQGRSYLTPLIAKDLLAVLLDAQSRSNGAADMLTPRQREILQLFAEGKTAKEVAASLSISIRTAEGHKYEIMDAIGAKTSAELVQHAIRMGLIAV